MAKPKPDPEIAARLKQARAQIFTSAAEAAQALGINPVTLRTHEAGTRGIGYTDLMIYARRYGVALDWILTGKGEPADIGQAEAFLPDTLPIMAVLNDGSWLPDDDQNAEYPGWATQKTPAGVVELVTYSDPRFPPEMINALRVRTDHSDGIYPDGAIVFVIPAHEIGYRDGDHVVIVRRRSGFAEWTLRRVVKGKDGEAEFEALLSQDPSFQWSGYPADIATDVVGVVVGALIRRPVPDLPLSARTEHETIMRRRQRYGDT